ncbi:hypothetical protein GCM10023208_13200 [Erythrobacter westpacificensis]|uniref:Lipoprotein n=1 Tax=Erythrobacter westpacificensis TaxID=1055231 RepID=A0ABP9K9T6_9SPHN
MKGLQAFAVLGAITVSACSASEEAPAPAETYTVEVADTAPGGQPSAQEDIRRYLLQNYPDVAPGQFAYALHDLDGDGADEAIVYLASRYFCGTGGCNTLVLAPAGPMWREVANISVSRTPVAVAQTASNGWQDLLVSVGGGGAEAGMALLKFDGDAYPSNPTVPPAELTDQTGEVLLAEEPEMIALEAEAASGE